MACTIQCISFKDMLLKFGRSNDRFSGILSTWNPGFSGIHSTWNPGFSGILSTWNPGFSGIHTGWSKKKFMM